MRIWSIHPQYLDTKGLLALWRESLLAQKVLLGQTKGYTKHPQLIRFQEHPQPLHALSHYLHAVAEEADKRSYHFNRTKILHEKTEITSIMVSSGQIAYEWQHFLKKMEKRNNTLFHELKQIHTVQPHPLFCLTEGSIESWEVV